MTRMQNQKIGLPQTCETLRRQRGRSRQRTHRVRVLGRVAELGRDDHVEREEDAGEGERAGYRSDWSASASPSSRVVRTSVLGPDAARSVGLETTAPHSEMSAAFSSTVTTATMYVVVPLRSLSRVRKLRPTDQTKRLTVRPSVWIRSAQKMIAVAM